MKQYYVQTTTEASKTGKRFHNNVGVLIIRDDGSVILKLYMYPQTEFRVIDQETGTRLPNAYVS
jgi:hypothetical protein